MAEGGVQVTLFDTFLAATARNQKHIMVCGDWITDEYLHGVVMDDPNDGCQKFTERSRVIRRGGAANAADSITRWNVRVSVFGDPEGPIKKRFMVDGRCVYRHDLDRRSPESVLIPIRNAAMDMLANEKCDAVLLSDYDKGMLTPNFIKGVSYACKVLGIPCVADCKRAPDMYSGCILKCNMQYQHIHNAMLAALIHEPAHGERLVVTAGPLPPMVWDRREAATCGYDMPEVRCVNHVGAGDCFSAHLTLALAHGFTLLEAARIAHAAARVYVQHAHNRPPLPAEVGAMGPWPRAVHMPPATEAPATNGVPGNGAGVPSVASLGTVRLPARYGHAPAPVPRRAPVE